MHAVSMTDIATNDVPEITLGWRLRIAMEHAGIKAEQMAVELGVHRGTLTRWTHGVGAEPRAIYLKQWAELCNVPYAWLVGDLYEDPTKRRSASATGGGTGRDNGRYGALADLVAAIR